MSDQENQKSTSSASEGSESGSSSGSSGASAGNELGFSFSQSAIADLPSTAVQSIHIENDTPVEVDDAVFVWRDVSPSGTKLPTKHKYKRHEFQQGKVPSAAALTAKERQSKTGQANAGKQCTGKQQAQAQAQPPPSSSSDHNQAGKVSSHESKQQLHATRRPSNDRRASQCKLTTAEHPSRQAKVASKTKLTHTRPKHNK